MLHLKEHRQLREPDELKNTPDPPLQMQGSRYWRGVSHATFLNLITAEVDRRRWQRTRARCHLNGTGSCLCASWTISVPGVELDNKHRLAMACINANDQEFAMSVILGVVEAKTEVGVPLREFRIGRHTENRKQQLEHYVNRAIAQASLHTQAVARTPTDLDFRVISGQQAEGYLIQAARLNLMPWSRIGEVDKKCQYEERLSAWKLIHYFAMVGQKNPPVKQLKSSLEFSSWVAAGVRL